MRWMLLVVMAACGAPEPPARSPQQRAADSAPAIAALQASRFDDAGRQASAALALDPRNARAAAVRAVATYQAAAQALYYGLDRVIGHGSLMKGVDHEEGRATWAAFLGALDAVDRDLAVAATDPGFSLELCLACWEHDWNHNGRIDDRDRKLFEIEFDGKGGDLAEGDPRRRPTFRFDVGDVDWARAMIAFQRAAVELVLAYRWTELDKLFGRGEPRLVLPVVAVDRVRRARAAIALGVGFADRCRAEYLAETDDDREWVPSPRQRNHPMPLEVDAQLYETWAGVTGDVRRLLASEEGLSLREVGQLIDRRLALLVPDAYIDVGRMLDEPTEIVIDTHDSGKTPAGIERILRGLLGHGYRDAMRRSPLVGRLRRMHDELDRGEDTFDRKLRYLLWLN